jgi:hypothetical protein
VQSGTALLQTFRVAVHKPSVNTPSGTAEALAALFDANKTKQVLKPKGIDRLTGVTALGIGRAAPYQKAGNRECYWSGLTSAQLPQYLFVVMEKSMDMVNLESLHNRKIRNANNPIVMGLFPNNAAGLHLRDASTRNQYLARNTDSNAAITQFSLEIMSVQGSYIYSSREWPYLKSRSDLYRDVQKYCIDTYDDQDTWFKHNCIVLLGVSDFAKGISSSGTAFPCTFSVRARFENWRQFVDGYGCAAGGQNPCGLGAAQDIIDGEPVLGMIFPQQSLQISASSALLSSQNISHSSAMELLSRQ